MSAAARWLGFIGLFLVIGASSFRLLASGLAAGAAERVQALVGRTRRVGLAGAVILLIACLLRLLEQVRAFSDPGAPLDWATVRLIVDQTSWGAGWRWQVGLAIAAGAAFVLASQMRAGWWAALLAGIASAVAATFTGHAVEHPWGATAGVALTSIHFLAGAVWLGTLAAMMLTIFGRGGEPAGEGRETLVAAAVHRYSPVALTAGAVTIAAGLLAGWTYVGSLQALFSTDYGRMLLVKLALVGCVAAVGAWNWRRLRPALGAAPGAARLRRSATAELLFGTLLLVATAVLVALPAPAI